MIYLLLQSKDIKKKEIYKLDIKEIIYFDLTWHTVFNFHSVKNSGQEMLWFL